MKPLTVKVAEKWFDKLKSDNVNAFKDIVKNLKKFEKSNDQFDCFVRLNNILLEYPELTKELNQYLEDANKFIVNKTEVQRINELVKYVKKIKPQTFQEIVSLIKDLSSKKGTKDLSQDQQNKILKQFILERVKGHPELENYAEKALNYSAQQLISKLDLSHLTRAVKPSSVPTHRYEESVQASKYQQPVNTLRQQEIIYEQVKPKLRTYPPFLNNNEEKVFIRNIQSKFGSQYYEQIVKIIYIFHIGIITRAQALEQIKKFVGGDYEGLKDIIQTREADRRKNNIFKPLNDMDFTNAQRATLSYVNMPASYPNICSGGNKLSKQVLNRTWVSVPIGSEDHFNLRVRNNFEQNLIKAEDDRYQIDLNLKRIKKGIQMLTQIISKLEKQPTEDVSLLLKRIINFGIIQYVYKNASKQQKDQIQYYLKNSTMNTCCMLKQRLKHQLIDIQEIRNFHGIRNWSQIAAKNWNKSLDFKGHQFKRTERLKMKPQVFLDELKAKANYLQKKGNSKEFDTPFHDRKQFFSVLNSFQTSSRKQRCQHRKITTPESYNIAQYNIPIRLPAMILGFEDEKALNLTLSYIFFYIEYGANESDKIKCHYILKQILPSFFGIQKVQHRKINLSKYNEQTFLTALNKSGNEQKNENLIKNDWFEESEQEFPHDHELIQIPKIYLNRDFSEYSYLPKKAENNLVFFCSENFYVFLRYLYAAYERIIRLLQISGQNTQKAKLFEILYFNHIKSKQNIKFEDSLNMLFGQNAFMFTTFYKLIQGCIKSSCVLSNCPITSYSLKLFKTVDNQDIYLLLLNKYYLLTNVTNPKILRFTYFQKQSKLLYINMFQSYYKTDDLYKDLTKRRNDISSKIETYTFMRDYIDWQNAPQMLVNNKIQYHFEGNTIKLSNIAQRQDMIVNKNYKCEEKRTRLNKKKLEKQINRLKFMNDYLS